MWQSVRRTPCRTRGEGATLIAGSAAPDGPGGELDSLNGLNTRWQHDTENNRHLSAARSEGTQRSCV